MAIYIHSKMRIAPEEHPVLLMERPLNPKANRERMTQIMFETFNVPLLYVTNQDVLALRASGRATGVVLDSTHGATHSVPVCDGYAITHAATKMDIAGKRLTEYGMKIFTDREYSCMTIAEGVLVREMMEKVCYVAVDYDEEMRKADKSGEIVQQYKFADGEFITVGKQRFQVFFYPGLLGMTSPGVHEIIVESIKKCETDIRAELYQNILLAGGSTMFPGFVERMSREVSLLSSGAHNVEVVGPAQRKFSAWSRGSLLASTSTFLDMCITKDEYDEVGPIIVHQKCV